jgi:nucleotide-binding universal stress UspA family protein
LSVFERIVVAVDGSAQSRKTMDVAVDLARRYGSEVTVVHVREYERFEGSDVDLGPPTPAESLLKDAVAEFEGAGVQARSELRRVRPGETPEQIVEVATSTDADLIVMGTRGMTEWKSLLLGGVATKVVHHATCPVLLVR